MFTDGEEIFTDAKISNMLHYASTYKIMATTTVIDEFYLLLGLSLVLFLVRHHVRVHQGLYLLQILQMGNKVIVAVIFNFTHFAWCLVHPVLE